MEGVTLLSRQDRGAMMAGELFLAQGTAMKENHKRLLTGLVVVVAAGGLVLWQAESKRRAIADRWKQVRIGDSRERLFELVGQPDGSLFQSSREAPPPEVRLRIDQR